jgi:hypothetical protein
MEQFQESRSVILLLEKFDRKSGLEKILNDEHDRWIVKAIVIL